MLSEIKTRYSQSLKRSKTFLKSQKTTPKSSSITSTRELCLLRNQAECPICAIKFSGKNHNTEHIHPRALGGLNDDENKIQMCTACNNSRNLTMQSMLGNPPYYKNYQSIKADVDEFILWSEVTADEGFLAGTVFPRAQEIFTEARFANTEPPMPKRAYGRFSTWDKDSLPNLKFNQTPIRTSPIEHNQSKRKIGLVERFFDKLFGYEPKKPEIQIKQDKKELPEVIQRNESPKQASSKSKPSTTEGKVKSTDTKSEGSEGAITTEKQLKNDVLTDLSQFKMDIIMIVGSKKLSNDDLGRAIQKWMIERGYENYNPTSFLRLHNLPRGLKKALQTHCSDYLNISGDDIWHVDLKDELVVQHRKLESEIKWKLEKSDNEAIPLKDFWPIVKDLKESSGLTWNQFMEKFGLKNTGEMGGVAIKSKIICSTLAIDVILEKKGKEHFVKYSSSD
tara:strand:+ start:491 stop:1840 length:1350 start_codon:yes stop_codon:yes gene_type:complete